MLACAAVASALTASGASVTYNFDTDPVPALEVYQTGFLDTEFNSRYWGATGGNPATGGFLGVTWPLGSSSSIIIFPDIDDGKIVSAFKLETDLRVGNPQQNERAADGFSVSFARADDPVFANHSQTDFATSGAVETGTRTGLSISFDTWSGNALPDTSDIEGIIVRVDNVTINKTALGTRNGACDDNTSLQTGPRDLQYWQNNPAGGTDSAFDSASWSNLCWQRLSVELSTNSQLTVVWKGRTILDKYQTTFFPSAGGIVLAGRTGGADQHTHFDNLTLTTIAAASDVTPPTAPANLRAQTVGAYRLVLAWDPSTDDSQRVAYELERDGTAVAGQFVQATNEFRGLTASTAYQYRVRATDVSGNKSEWTSVLSVTTAADVADSAYAGAKVYGDGESGLGTTVWALISNPIYPDSPTSVRRLNDMMMSFGEPSFGDTFGDNFGARIAGTITPPTTGLYNFFVRSDDASQLYLNVDGPAIPVADDFSFIATESGCCEAFKEQTDPVTEQPFETTTAPILLTAGQKYGILFLVKEGGGGDWGQVAWRKVGDPTAAASLPPIAFPYFESESPVNADPVGAEVTITQQPQAQTIVANTTVSFSVAATFSSPYATTALYHWYKNGAPVYSGTTYTIPFAQASENGAKIKVIVSVPGKSVTSDEVTLTVNVDDVPPTFDVAGIHGSQDLSHVTVKFSEPVTDPTATTAGNYTMEPALAVTSATRVDQTTILLTTGAQTPNTKYTLTVNNVKDVGDNSIAANSKVDWMSWVVVGTAGPVAVDIYDGVGGATAGGIPGTAVSALTSYAGYPGTPDVTATIAAWNTRLVYADDSHENYGGRMTGLITPNETGSYRFFLHSDDASELWLNKTGTSEGGLVKIAQETACCNPFTEPGTQRTSDPIPLTAGTQYLLRGLWKEGGGGDYLRVAWRKEGNPQPAASLQPIPAPFDPWAGAPFFTTQPMGAAVAMGASITLTADVALGQRPVSFKWQRLEPSTTWVDIPGATAASYTVEDMDLSKVGAYRCFATNPTGTAGSRAVVLTMANTFVIEAEDFDYDGGQHKAAASTMPYIGGAYAGLSATYNVDYHNDNNDSVTHRTPFAAGQGVSMNENLGGLLGRDRGAWEVTVDYKIGWIGGGDWHNYTRTVPAGTYTAMAALSYDGNGAGQLKAKLSKVTAGVGTTTQTLEDVGLFDQVGSRGWGQNNLVPMKDAGGATAVFTVTDPVTTLRMSHDSGDFDWFMLVPTGQAEQPVITKILLNADGSVTIEWTGAGVLEVTDSLTAPVWQTVAVSSPATLTPPTGATTLFGRIKQ